MHSSTMIIAEKPVSNHGLLVGLSQPAGVSEQLFHATNLSRMHAGPPKK